MFSIFAIAFLLLSPTNADNSTTRSPPPEGNLPAVGACTDLSQSTSSYVNSGQLYYKSTVTENISGKQGTSSHHTNSHDAAEYAIMDLFGPLDPGAMDPAGTPMYCEADTTHLQMWQTNGTTVHHDCSCTPQSLVVNPQCTLEVGACIMFPTKTDLEDSNPSYKGYAFPTDGKACVGQTPEQCSPACMCTETECMQNGEFFQYFYNSADAVTQAVANLVQNGRVDLMFVCGTAAMEEMKHLERHENKSPEWHSVVKKLSALANATSILE